jgi:hypothetical protein
VSFPSQETAIRSEKCSALATGERRTITRSTPLDHSRFGAEGVRKLEKSERRLLAATVVVAVSMTAVILVGLHMAAGDYLVQFGAASF